MFTNNQMEAVLESKVMQIKSPRVCPVETCNATAEVAGLCPKHYQQIRRHGHLTPEREYRKRGTTCEAEGCSEAQTAKGYCFRHYQQVRRFGRLTPERERVYGRTHCSHPGCSEPHAARNYCKKHYRSEYYDKILHNRGAMASAAGGG